MRTIELSQIGKNAFEKNQYAVFFEEDEDIFNSPLISDLEDSYNNIIADIRSLTNDQEKVLKEIYNVFLYVQKVIDPHRLQDFSYLTTEDDDLILFRNTPAFLINLIIHPEDDFTLSIIGKNEDISILKHYDNDAADYEKVVYDFLRD